MKKILLILLLFLLPIYGFANGGATYGPTTKADQLWQIAVFVRPSTNVSLAQTIEALKKKNPHAFVGNKVKSGVILKVPSLAEISHSSSFPRKPKPKQWANNYSPLQVKNEIAKQNVILKKQIDDETKDSLSKMDQQYQARLVNIEQHNLALQNQITGLSQQLSTLQNEINEPIYIKLRDSLGGYGLYIAVGIIVVLFLLLFLWLSPSGTAKKTKAKIDKDTESEYDFMGSSEGIPAKLDLARAYIDMGDNKAARDILDEIIKQGNKEQQEEAQGLLARIK